MFQGMLLYPDVILPKLWGDLRSLWGQMSLSWDFGVMERESQCRHWVYRHPEDFLQSLLWPGKVNLLMHSSLLAFVREPSVLIKNCRQL